MRALKITSNSKRYQAMIGTGGIGSGMFFRLNGDHTLGREESRSGYFLDRKDYCKLHIISYYVKALLGADFEVILLGKVGDDTFGNKLLNDLRDIGFSMDYIESSPKSQTLFSYCFIYPDGSGGNLTTCDSACSKVSPEFIRKSEKEFAKHAGNGIALAAPEVPLAAREEILELGTKYNFYTAASFTSEELPTVSPDIFKNINLLAVNLDEAAALVGKRSDENDTRQIIDTAVKMLTEINPTINISITNGKKGSWIWDGNSLTHLPVYNVNVVNTAGAGDAHLSGLLVGLTAGLSLKEAHQLANLVSGCSVESEHTINTDITRDVLRELDDKNGNKVSENIHNLLED